MMYFANKIMIIRLICSKLYLLTRKENISSIINNIIFQQRIYQNIETGLQSCNYINTFLTDLKFILERNEEFYDETCIDVKNIDYLMNNISMCKNNLKAIREHLENDDITHAIRDMKNLDANNDLITVNTKNIFNDLGLETEGFFYEDNG